MNGVEERNHSNTKEGPRSGSSENEWRQECTPSIWKAVKWAKWGEVTARSAEPVFRMTQQHGLHP